jgi:hypothetical protein
MRLADSNGCERFGAGRGSDTKGAGARNTRPTVCGFCKGKPVGNAARWIDKDAPPTAPCPRCGETNE